MKKLFAFLRRHSSSPWFVPLICLLAFVDLFVLFIPTEGLIVSLVLLKKKKHWWIYGTLVTTASAIGALALGALAAVYGEPFVAWILGPDFLQSANWIKMNGWIEKYGFGGLWFISLGPLPQQPAILICALAKLSLFSIAAAVWAGRLPKYLLFAYFATHGSAWIKEHFEEELKELTGEELPPPDPVTAPKSASQQPKS